MFLSMFVKIFYSILKMFPLILTVLRQACADPTTVHTCGDWLKGSVLGEQLLGLIEELCRIEGSSPISANSAGDHRWALISLVLSQNHNNGERKYIFSSFSKLLTVLSDLKRVILYLFLLAQSL